MKLAILKNKAVRLTVIASLIVSLAGIATAAMDPRYTIEEVAEACEASYDSGHQVVQCITNVCLEYGCEGW